MTVKSEKAGPSVDVVDAVAVDEAIQAKGIGQRIRRLRLKRSMGLVELGQLVGLSASFLSQLETGRVIPTMRNLARIALAFKKDIGFFLVEDEASSVFRISHEKDRIRLHTGEKEATFMVADNMGILLRDSNTVPCIAEFFPGMDAKFAPRIFPGLELVYVIDGVLRLVNEHKTELLEAGDSAWIDSNSKRHYKCEQECTARALIMSFALGS